MRPLTRWTAGLVGERDPAQPLLTLVTAQGRVELSGATTANWVAKSAGLFSEQLGGPTRLGLLLPLHWQSVALLLAGVTVGATTVVARELTDLAGCDVAAVRAPDAEAALDAGCDEVLVLPDSPMGLAGPAGAVPPAATDFARDVPGYGDAWTGPLADTVDVELDGVVLPPAAASLSDGDRVLVAGALADVLPLLLGGLHAGAALVLLDDPAALDLPAVARAEQITATVGLVVGGLRRLALEGEITHARP